MRTVCLSLAVLLLIAAPCFPVTVMKNVGHGDCYVVISDGRVVVVDLGPASSAKGLVSLLKTDYAHYDRIIVTHVHSDHVGGLITAEQYARETGAALSADRLVSSHGAHDLDLVVRDSTLRQLRGSLKGRSIVGMRDDAPAALALNDENIEIRGILLGEPGTSGRENASGLVVKVTEIRDGERRATLFLGDIEQAQQAELFTSPEAEEVFRDVRAVTLPHHGRASTLAWDFFTESKRLAGSDVVFLHSDAAVLDPQVAQQATEAGARVKSTAAAASKSADVLVNLFEESTYHVVGKAPAKLPSIVRSQKGTLLHTGDYTTQEVVEAVSSYCHRSTSAPLRPGTVISMPSDAWIRGYINDQRQASNRETEALISRLQSADKGQVALTDQALARRFRKLTQEQKTRVNEIRPGAVERWELQNASPVEREIRIGLKQGWAVKRNINIDDSKLYVYEGRRGRGRSYHLRYLVRETGDGTWRIHTPGRKNGKGIPAYGKRVGIIRSPNGVNVIDRTVCEYCGKDAVGWCTIREKDVCEEHRYFTQGGVNWRCP